MGTAPNHRNATTPGRDQQPTHPDQSPAETPDRAPEKGQSDQNGRSPPDSLPNPMPDVDPQQTPGIDRL